MNAAQIQEQINNIDAAIQQGAPQGQIDRWNDQKAELEKQLTVQQAEEAHGARVENTRTHALSAIERITYNGLTLRSVCGSDDDYDIAKHLVDMLTTAQAEQSSLLIQGYEEREIQITRQLKLANESTTEMSATIGRLEAEAVTSTLEKNDAITKRNAASLLLDEANTEIKRLNKEVAEKRAQIELGLIGSMKVVESEEQIAEREAAAERTKIRKTIMPEVVPDREINPLNFQITIAATGEKIWIKHYDLNGYTKLTDPNEVEQFRLKHAEKDNIPDMDVVDKPDQTAEVKPPDTFQEAGLEHAQNDNGEAELPPMGNNGEGETTQAAPVTRAEFETWQERVTALEVWADNLRVVA